MKTHDELVKAMLKKPGVKAEVVRLERDGGEFLNVGYRENYSSVMRPYAVLRSEVEKLGAVCLKEQIYPEFFGGSAHCLFEANDCEFRLVWDGKEEYGFLEVPDASGGWVVAGPFVNDVSSPKGTKFVEFIETAKRLVSGSDK
ncbi:MAG: hypothetical protein RLZZ271_1585 [Pseudomonadota bacterium]|jgi:hypothetical protein